MKYDADPFHRIEANSRRYGMALPLALIAIAAGPLSEAEAKTIPASEQTLSMQAHETAQQLAAHETVPFANGTLTFKVKITNRFNPDSKPEIVTNEIKDPLIQPLGKTALKKKGNDLTSGNYTFGYIITNGAPATKYMNYSAKTMKFIPDKNGPEIIHRKFEDLPEKPGFLNYRRPLNCMGKFVRGLVGISVHKGDTPNPDPVRQ